LLSSLAVFACTLADDFALESNGIDKGVALLFVWGVAELLIGKVVRSQWIFSKKLLGVDIEAADVVFVRVEGEDVLR
jgi:hypothetical protein